MFIDPYLNSGGLGVSEVPGGYQRREGFHPLEPDGFFNPPVAMGNGFESSAIATQWTFDERFFFLLGCFWGTTTGLSMLIGALFWRLPLPIVMGGELGVVLLCLFLYGRGPAFLLSSLVDPAGVLMGLHLLAAIASAAVANVAPIMTVRYLLLTASFSAMVYARSIGPKAIGAMRAGLTCGGFVVCIFNVPSISLGALNDPLYRLSAFLNPNANAIIGSITAISVLDYAIGYWNLPDRRKRSVMLFCLAVLPILVVYLTRSRTGTLAMLAGIFVLLLLSTRLWVSVTVGVLAIPFYFIFHGAFASLGHGVSNVYALGERGRDIASLTGRTEAWQRLAVIWEASPVFGGGPGAAVIGSHNGFLYNLAEVGALGTLPLICLIMLATLSSIIHRKDPAMRAMIAIVAASLVESLAESEFFSFGSPSGLLFLLAVSTLVGALFGKVNEPLLSGVGPLGSGSEPAPDQHPYF